MQPFDAQDSYVNKEREKNALKSILIPPNEPAPLDKLSAKTNSKGELPEAVLGIDCSPHSGHLQKNEDLSTISL